MCNNYKVLSGGDRAQGRVLKPGKGWYRFQGAAGDRIADKCVLKGHCGVEYRGWRNGSYPTVNEGAVTRKFCGNAGAAKLTCCLLCFFFLVNNQRMMLRETFGFGKWLG